MNKERETKLKEKNGPSYLSSFFFSLIIVLILIILPQQASAAITDILSFSDNFNALTNGTINSQNGWHSSGATGADTWNIGSDGLGGKLVSQTTSTAAFSVDYITNDTATLKNGFLKFDFKVPSISSAPQIWLRKTATTGDAGGYLIFYNGSGSWTLVAHTAGSGGAFTTLSTATGALTLSINTFYTAEAQVIDDGSGNPVINLYVYAQGGTRGTAALTFTDTNKNFLSGYFGMGANGEPVSIDNVELHNIPPLISNLSAYGSNAQVALNWTAPTVGGSPITDYLIEYQVSSSGQWTTFAHSASSATTATITGLINNISYDFRVSAIYTQGTGTVSNTATTRPLPQVFSDNFDALTNGNINGQNGWHVSGDSGDNTWNIGTDGASGKLVNQTTSASGFNVNYISNDSVPLTNTRLKVDFYNQTNGNSPQFWLRKTSPTGDAGGYLIFLGGGTWTLGAHTASSGGIFTSLKTASSPITISQSVWYTFEAEAIDDVSGNPVINLYVYAQGGTRPINPFMTYVDSSKRFLSGSVGLGSNGDNVSYDNLVISGKDTSVLTITTPARSVFSAPNVATLKITDEGGDFFIPYIQTSSTFSPSVTIGSALVPSGGGMKFVLNQGLSNEQILYSVGGNSPYTVSFSNLSKGTYTLDTYTVNASSVVQSGASNHDSETGVGIGDIITLIGDSTTAGHPYDLNQVSDWIQATSAGYSVSTDNRNFPQHDPGNGKYKIAYTKELNNALSSYFGYPIFLMNEGVSGDTTSDYDTLITATQWINRQTSLAPNKWIIHLGINDANASVLAATYKTNMQTIITALKNTYSASSTNIIIAKPLYIQSNATAQGFEQSYSTKIDELVNTNSLSSSTPNFYSYFSSYTGTLYSDNYHPNTAGYSQMAKLLTLSFITPKNINISQSGTTVNLSWNDLSLYDSQIAGYKIKYGTSPGVYTTTVDVGNVLTKSITGLTLGQTYYFAISAYDNDPFNVTQTANSVETPYTPTIVVIPLSTPAQTSSTAANPRISSRPHVSVVTVETTITHTVNLPVQRSFGRSLFIGSKGLDVAALQKFLISKNSGPSARALGSNGSTLYFGRLTKSALIEFQMINGITPSIGYFGPKTREFINR